MTLHAARTLPEKILSEKAGRDARTGDIVVCEPDLILGTDGSTPMALDYFESMGGDVVAHPERVLLARDHYAPPSTPTTLGFHARMEDFASRQGVQLLPVGGGISFQVALETNRVSPGDLVVGADSHTVMCGAVGAFATGVGSADLAGALLSGRVWLRVPDVVRVVLDGSPGAGVGAKDVALEMVRRIGSDGATHAALEFVGPGARDLPPDERMVLSNMSAEVGAMAGVFPVADFSSDSGAPVRGEMSIDASALVPTVAIPHDPARGVPVAEAAGAPVDWVFLGTCTGGRAHDFREALRVLDAGGGVAAGVTVVVTPPTPGVRSALEADGTLARLASHGAVITETGCGPCCGTSGPLPPSGGRVISTANRNFRGRMGEPTAQILLASPATCAAAATVGKVVDPRRVGGTRSEGQARARRVGAGTSTVAPSSGSGGGETPTVDPQGLGAREALGTRAMSGESQPALASYPSTRRFGGRARRLGDRVNTDYIIASRRKKETLDPRELSRWLLEGVDPDFAASVQPGDILVAGEAFGCGSAMEVAVTVVRAAGIPVVLAKSFARTYFRNAVNNGLLLVECDTSEIADGDWLEVTVAPGAVTVGVRPRDTLPGATAPAGDGTPHDSTRPAADDDGHTPSGGPGTIVARPFPPFILDILMAGGLAPYLRGRGGFEAGPSTGGRGR